MRGLCGRKIWWKKAFTTGGGEVTQTMKRGRITDP